MTQEVIGGKRQHLLQAGITAGGIVRRDGQWYNYFEKIRPVWRRGKSFSTRTPWKLFRVFSRFCFRRGAGSRLLCFCGKPGRTQRGQDVRTRRALGHRLVLDCVRTLEISNFPKLTPKIECFCIAIPLKIRKGSTSTRFVYVKPFRSSKRWCVHFYTYETIVKCKFSASIVW